MAVVGEKVHEARDRVIALLSGELSEVLASMGVDFPGMSLVLRSGWTAGESLTGALNASAQSDRQRGFTQGRLRTACRWRCQKRIPMDLSASGYRISG